MSHSRRRRSRRNSRLKARVFLGSCLLAVIALALAAILGAPLAVRPTVVTEPPAAAPAVSQVTEPAAALPPRPVYRYSVVNGGVYSAGELAHAIATDSTVADHYRAIDVARVRAESVPKPVMAYMLYRRNGRIYWTRHKVQLQQGETILTDGNSQVRARCGNCISLDPMQPTAPDEPVALEFDALDPEPVGLPSRTFMASGTFASIGAGVLVPEPFGAMPFSGFGPLPIGRFAEDPSGTQDPTLFDPDPIDLPDLPDLTVGDPACSSGLCAGDPPGTPKSPDVLVNLPPVTPPIDVPEDFDPDPPGDSDDPPGQPVPEPGTLLLVGGGLGWAIRRGREQMRRYSLEAR